MKRVLIVCPHFPPTDAVDMHRIRMTAPHYREFGFEPVVLAARPEDAGRLVDEGLAATVPADLEVRRIAVPTRRLPAMLGLNALGIRGWPDFEAAGNRLLAERKFDLVLFSTTDFPLMALGPRWQRRFGVPFVLDFQDPWATYSDRGRQHFRKGVRHSLMRAFHSQLERRTVPAAGGLMATSATFLDLLRSAYPQTEGLPLHVSPFGWSRQDLDTARRGRAGPPAFPEGPAQPVVCVFAGRVAPTMQRLLDALFALVAKGVAQGEPLLSRLVFYFVGTGYGESEHHASRLAAVHGLSSRVIEHPDRVPLHAAIKITQEADVVMLAASEDQTYTPSKLYSTLALDKPLICLAGEDNPIWTVVGDLPSVVSVSPAAEPDAVGFGQRLQGAMKRGLRDDRRRALTQPFEARECARRDCGFLHDVLDRRNVVS